jgi:hypothetical protein
MLMILRAYGYFWCRVEVEDQIYQKHKSIGV